MASLASRWFGVQIFPTSEPVPGALQGIWALTDLGAVALVMQQSGFESVVKACVVDEQKRVVLFFGVRFAGLSVCYEHRVAA